LDLHLEGSTPINADQATVYRLLTDTKFLSTTLPDSEEVKVVDDTSLEAKIRVRVAVVSTRLAVKMSIVESRPPTMAKLEAQASGIGSNMMIKSTFELSGSRPTNLRWTADAELTGVVAGLGSSVLRGFAARKVDQIFSGITKAIEANAS
jgi:carbon monoxide dehydrogenase subunit G